MPSNSWHDGDFECRYIENVKEICDNQAQRVVKVLSHT